MPLVDTGGLDPRRPLPPSANHQVYCGLDCCTLPEIWGELQQLGNRPPEIYQFEKALQGPYLEIMLRGFKIDEGARREASTGLRQRIGELQQQLDRLACAVWDRGLNPRSPLQLRQLFYDRMKLPEVWLSQKGERKLSTNREALEKLEDYLYARPFISLILTIRDLSKQLEVFETEIDSDGRYRTSYNIAGTETGRPSSSSNAFGTGGNAQNIAPSLRYPFESDPGWKLGVIDLEQVEARDVGFFCGCLFEDWTFLDACECLTEDHEVLTPDGWRYISDKPNNLAVWTPKSRELKFERVLNWNEGETMDLIEVNNIAISVKGTINHEMPVYSYRENVLEKQSLSSLLLSSKGRIAPNTSKYVGGEFNIKEASIIAAFQADGTRDDSGRVHWTFMKNRKIIKMRELLSELGLIYSEYNLSTGAVRFYLRQGQGQDIWPKECGKEILNWNKSSIENFCSSHKHWDASIEGNNIRIVGKSKEHISWLATAYSLSGKAVTINKHKNNYWILTVRTNTNTQYRSAKIEKIKCFTPQRVFCPTVSTGFFIVRRNDKIFISGNSGDLHTNNARRIWPELGWTDDKRANREIADRNFYRDFSYRDMAKRGSHLSNYMGTAWTASRHLKVPLSMMEDFQARYCRGRLAVPAKGLLSIEPAYPCIPRWWQWTAQQLQTTHQLTTPFGRRRHFFGRPGDDTTLREAIAFLPQSTTADRMNLGLWRVWKKMEGRVELLAQTYDSITFQFEDRGHKWESNIVEEALELIRVELQAPSGRQYAVPGEAKIGWNWGYQCTAVEVEKAKQAGGRVPKLNLLGLAKWSREKADLRQRGEGLRRRMVD